MLGWIHSRQPQDQYTNVLDGDAQPRLLMLTHAQPAVMHLRLGAVCIESSRTQVVLSFFHSLMTSANIQHKLNQLLDIRSSLFSITDADDRDTYPVILHLDDLIDDLKIELKVSTAA